MAVARAQSGPVLTGVHIALIAFVAVAVVALVFLVLWFVVQLAGACFRLPGIAWYAHLGGFGLGLLRRYACHRVPRRV